jgi:hypothetical protein
LTIQTLVTVAEHKTAQTAIVIYGIFMLVNLPSAGCRRRSTFEMTRK